MDYKMVRSREIYSESLSVAAAAAAAAAWRDRKAAALPMAPMSGPLATTGAGGARIACQIGCVNSESQYASS